MWNNLECQLCLPGEGRLGLAAGQPRESWRDWGRLDSSEKSILFCNKKFLTYLMHYYFLFRYKVYKMKIPIFKLSRLLTPYRVLTSRGANPCRHY